MKLREENEWDRPKQERFREREEEIYRQQFGENIQKQIKKQDQTSKEAEHSMFKLARGIDGRLYRIKLPDKQARQSNDLHKKQDNNQLISHATESLIPCQKDVNIKGAPEVM